MKLEWKALEDYSEMAQAIGGAKDRTSVIVKTVGDLSVVSVIDDVWTLGVLDKFRCTSMFASSDVAKEWVEETLLPKLAGLNPSARSFPADPKPDPVIDWMGDLGIVERSNEEVDMSFYLQSISNGIHVWAHDASDDFSCGMLLASREDAKDWAAHCAKKFRP
ncbi:MAG: hypothetical protein OXI16_13875 [Chloroflexota bacterium]|nr:hypothetical protein [Chloroflexota bacterium]